MSLIHKLGINDMTDNDQSRLILRILRAIVLYIAGEQGRAANMAQDIIREWDELDKRDGR